MALSDQEEFELLSLEREKAMAAQAPAAPQKLNAWGKPMGPAAEAAMRDMKARPFGSGAEHVAYKAGEKVTDLTGSPEAGFAANVLTQAVPALIGAGASEAAAPAFVSGAKSLMQQALKPHIKDLRLGKADRAAQTLLDEGINVSKGGVAELRKRGEAMNSLVDQVIASSGATVDKGAVASRLQDVIKRIEGTNWTPQNARAAVEKVYDDFLSNSLVPKNIPIAQAQELKQGIYKALKDKYGELASDTQEAMKAGARGFKEEIEKLLPDVGPINARASEIWNALNVTERRALLEGNHQIGGLAWLSHNPWTWAASMADRSSLVKSGMARLLNSGSKTIPGTVGATAGGILGAESGSPEDQGILSRRIAWMGSRQHGND